MQRSCSLSGTVTVLWAMGSKLAADWCRTRAAIGRTVTSALTVLTARASSTRIRPHLPVGSKGTGLPVTAKEAA